MAEVSSSLGGATSTSYGEVLEFDQETNTWKEIGQLDYPRRFHAMSVVSIDDVYEYCKPPVSASTTPSSGLMIKK